MRSITTDGHGNRTARAAKAAGVLAAAVLPLAALSSPAHAAVVADECKEQTLQPSTGGYDPTFRVLMCVQRDSTGVYRNEVYFMWNDAGDDEFHSVELHARLEKYDVTVKGARCDLTAEINDDDWSIDRKCQTVWAPGVAGQMTADATVLYDVRDDGKGEQRWDLAGTAAL